MTVEWIVTAFGCANACLGLAVWYRLGGLGARVEDHGRRLDRLEIAPA